jgi:hypothetical protein
MKAEQLNKIKEILIEQQEKETNGQAQAERLAVAIKKIQNAITTTEKYLDSESSKTYDDQGFRNHLKGEISGYKIALDLIKAAK